MPFTFSHRKATQALNYFARQAGGKLDKIKALKLVYFADRYHLRRFGRPVTGDEYLAMPYGPVASGTKDLAEMSDFLGEEERTYGARFIQPVEHPCFQSLAAPDPAVFSESDRQAVQWAWQNFGAKTSFDLVEATHAYPEWRRHEHALTGKTSTRELMSYRDFLDDPDPGVELCHPLSPKEREAVASGIDERVQFERLWQ